MTGLLIQSCREHPNASDVYVTGTFDNWTKSEKLDKKGDGFEKSVTLPDASQKIYYKVRNRVADWLCISHVLHKETAFLATIIYLKTA